MNATFANIKQQERQLQNVISKSGTTTETSIAFRIFKDLLETTKGKEVARKRIIATTDKEKGALKTLATNEGYTTFVVPDDVGGRYSVLTAVGLFPIAMAGINIDEMLNGAADARAKYNNPDLNTNEAYQYAVARQMLSKQGFPAEMFVTYELQLSMVAEWWKQLYGESEGKEQKGIFPAGVDFTTDLHSMGQYIQEGRRNLFETVISIESSSSDITINKDEDNLDGLNYLSGKTLDYVNKKAMEGTIKAHVSGDVPNIVINIEKLDEENIGEHSIFYYYILYKLGESEIQALDDKVVEQFIINLFNTRKIDSREVNMREKLEEMLREEKYSELIKLGACKIRNW